MARCRSQYLIIKRCYRSLELAVETVKPFEQREFHATVTIRPELKLSRQKVTQKQPRPEPRQVPRSYFGSVKAAH